MATKVSSSSSCWEINIQMRISYFAEADQQYPNQDLFAVKRRTVVTTHSNPVPEECLNLQKPTKAEFSAVPEATKFWFY